MINNIMRHVMKYLCIQEALQQILLRDICISVQNLMVGNRLIDPKVVLGKQDVLALLLE